MTRVLTPLALDQLQKKFAAALGISEQRVGQKLEGDESVVVTISTEMKSVKGSSIVHLQELAETFRFSVLVAVAEDMANIRITMTGTVQVCAFVEGPP